MTKTLQFGTNWIELTADDNGGTFETNLYKRNTLDKIAATGVDGTYNAVIDGFCMGILALHNASIPLESQAEEAIGEALKTIIATYSN